ncbi:MAG: reverse transcriptase-like protein [Terriglobales bacterium]
MSNSVISPAVLGFLIWFNARKMCSPRRRFEFGIFFIAGSTVAKNLPSQVGLNANALHVFSDSEVMVKQMSGEYSCRSPRLYSLNWICWKLARSLDFSIFHVRRENNTEANSLASSAARNAESQYCGEMPPFSYANFPVSHLTKF